MDELLTIVCGLSCLLVGTAVIGHGLWLAAAAIVRALRGKHGTDDVAAIDRPRQSHLRKYAVMRDLAAMRDSGELDKTTYEKVRTLLVYGSAPSPATTTQVAPPVTPPVVPVAAVDAQRDDASEETASPVAGDGVRVAAEAADEATTGVDHLDVVMPGEQAAPAEPVAIEPTTLSASPATPAPIAVPAQPVAHVSPAKPPAPPKPVEPRRTFGEWLATFMQEANIRWGEIVGGLLIVFCSTALVISLWQQITAVPWLQFSVFIGVTAALFLVGLYTHYKWKLPTTSHGILYISVLLVPLNFLAIAASTEALDSALPVVLGGEGLAAACFAALLWFTGPVVAPRFPRMLLPGVLAVSVWQLIVRRWVDTDASNVLLAGMAVVPLALTAVALVPSIWSSMHKPRLNRRDAHTTLSLIGVVSFSAVLALGLLVHKAAGPGDGKATLFPGGAAFEILNRMPWVVCTFFGLCAAGGLSLWRGVQSRTLATWRTAGTAVAALGVIGVIAGLALSWPRPADIVPTAVVAAVIAIALARPFRMPAMTFVGGLLLTVAALVAVLVFEGNLTWQANAAAVLRELRTAHMGKLLGGATAVLGLATAVLAHRKLPADAKWLGIAAGVTASLSLVLVTLHGALRTGDPQDVAIVYALYGGAALIAAWVVGADPEAQPVAKGITIAGAVLLFAALLQAFVFRWELHLGLGKALLTHATIGSVVALVMRQLGARMQAARMRAVFGTTWAGAAGVTSFVAACLLWVFALDALKSPGAMPWDGAIWLCGVWVVLAVAMQSRPTAWAAQGALLAALWLYLAKVVGDQPWFDANVLGLAAPRAVQWYAIAFAGAAAVWSIARLIVERAVSAPEALSADEAATRSTDNDPWHLALRRSLLGITPDVIALAASVVAACLLIAIDTDAAVALSAGVGLVAGDNPVSHDVTAWPWLMLGVIAVALIVRMWERIAPWLVVCGVAIVVATCAQVGTRFDDGPTAGMIIRVAVAAGYVLLALLIAMPKPLVALAKTMRWNVEPHPEQRTSRTDTAHATAALFVVPASVIAGVLVITRTAAITTHAASAAEGWWPAWFGYAQALPLVLIAVGLIVHSIRARRAAEAVAAWACLMVACVGVQVLGKAPVDAVRDSLYACITLTALFCAAATWLARRLRPVDIAVDEDEITPDMVGLGMSVIAVCAMIGFRAAHVVALSAGEGINVSAMQANTMDRGVWPWLALGSLAFALIMRARVRATIWLGAAGACVFVACALQAATGFDDGPTAGIAIRVGLGAAYAVVALLAARPAWALQVVHRLGWRASEHNDEPAARAAAAHVTTSLLVVPVVLITSMMALYHADLVDTRSQPTWLADWPDWFGHAQALPLIFVAVGLIIHAVRERRAVEAVIAWVCLMLAVICEQVIAQPAGGDAVEGSLYGCITVTALFAAVSIPVTHRLARSEELIDSYGVTKLHFAAAWSCVVLITLLTGAALLGSFFGATGALDRALPAIVATATMLALMLPAKVRGVSAAPLLYWTGLCTIGHIVAAVTSVGDWRAFAMAHGSTLYALIGAWIARRLTGMKSTQPTQQPTWLIAMTVLIAIAASLISLGMATMFESGLAITQASETALRMVAASACLIGATAVAMCATGDNLRLRGASVVFATIGVPIVILAGTGSGNLVETMNWLALTASAWLIGAIALCDALPRLIRTDNPWRRVGQNMSALPFVLAGMAVGVLLLIELPSFRGETMADLARYALTAALAGAVAWSLVNAFRTDDGDPLQVPAAARGMWAYAAQAIGGLLFAHVRLSMPWLFSEWITAWWPLITTLVGMTGLGVGYALTKSGRDIVGRPFTHVGTVMPLAAAIGWWLIDSATPYPMLMGVISVLYLVLALQRESITLWTLAIVTGHVGLWHLLYDHYDVSLLDHPQFWLAPFAVALLIAGQFNRDRLSPAQLTGLRYICLIMLYVSSTAEIFIQGVTSNAWMPLVLMVLSAVGVVVGLLLRVRSFVYLSATFLLVSLITMIRYASVAYDIVWLWWVAGIALGIAIIALFAMFEKKRNEMTAALTRFRGWEA